MGPSGAVTNQANRCIRCEALNTVHSSLKGWLTRRCEACLAMVLLCPECARWSKRAHAVQLVHIGMSEHALYTQLRF